MVDRSGHGQVYDWAALEEFVPESMPDANGNGHHALEPAVRSANWDRIERRSNWARIQHRADESKLEWQKLDEISEVFASVTLETVVEPSPREHDYAPDAYKDQRDKFIGTVYRTVIAVGFSAIVFGAAAVGDNPSSIKRKCAENPAEKCIEYVPGYARGQGILSLFEGASVAVSGFQGYLVAVKGLNLATQRRRKRATRS